MLPVIVVVLALAGLWAWALIDVLSWPSATWEVADLSKARWVVRILLLGVIGVVLYVRSARRPLRAAYLTIRTAG
ncbi:MULTISPECIES: PLDc N-terminal domain-containing protein [unclassified Nocardioides]|uniref:PLDc N-terminal domain-containing protein n=1 Tax=unclassified Nocardioides TaxID=2615069 RepID=UPI001167842C|nr:MULTISPECIES: PLDc N-terminal domain-containing protein [unclassified Nocardioides]TQK68411.1 phospholipase D-like protein [Nocardioides sp. SLBN-35]WGY02276.1 PLDc N-terminal domain-containing protein [Nocardioides sp. QY071]